MGNGAFDNFCCLASCGRYSTKKAGFSDLRRFGAPIDNSDHYIGQSVKTE
jgi:hypothetical protein